MSGNVFHCTLKDPSAAGCKKGLWNSQLFIFRIFLEPKSKHIKVNSKTNPNYMYIFFTSFVRWGRQRGGRRKKAEARWSYGSCWQTERCWKWSRLSTLTNNRRRVVKKRHKEQSKSKSPSQRRAAEGQMNSERAEHSGLKEVPGSLCCGLTTVELNKGPGVRNCWCLHGYSDAKIISAFQIHRSTKVNHFVFSPPVSVCVSSGLEGPFVPWDRIDDDNEKPAVLIIARTSLSVQQRRWWVRVHLPHCNSSVN